MDRNERTENQGKSYDIYIHLKLEANIRCAQTNHATERIYRKVLNSPHDTRYGTLLTVEERLDRWEALLEGAQCGWLVEFVWLRVRDTM